MENLTFVFTTSDYKNKDIFLRAKEVGIVGAIEKDTLIVNFVDLKHPIRIEKKVVREFDPSETGDAYEFKICNVCNRLLKTTEFARNQNGINNRPIRRPSCNDCRKIIDGVSVTSAQRREWTKTKPNYEIWECPVCQKRTIPGLTSKVVLDHDHSNGKPRDWICDSCNTGLGRFKDDIELLQNAIDYLKNTE